MKEKTIVNNIVQFLERIPGCHVIKTCGSGLPAGTPDLIGSYRGHPFAFEVKRPGENATEIQKYELREWLSSGAAVAVVRSVDDVKNAFANYLDGKDREPFLIFSGTKPASEQDSLGASSASKPGYQEQGPSTRKR